MKAQTLVKWLIFALGLVIVLNSIRPADYSEGPDFERLAELPVLGGGRTKPLDTVARNSLLILGGKQTWQDAEGKRRPAIEWLAKVILNPSESLHDRVFRIDNHEVLGLLGLGLDGRERPLYSYSEIAARMQQLGEQLQLVNPEAQKRTPYERALVKLGHGVTLYNGLAVSAIPPRMFGDSAMSAYQSLLALREMPAHALGSGDEQARMHAQAGVMMTQMFRELASEAEIKIVPPPVGSNNPDDWKNLGEAALAAFQSGELDPVLVGLGTMSENMRSRDWAAFNAALEKLHAEMAERSPESQSNVAFEQFFNHTQPFMVAMTLYVIVFLVAAFSWLFWGSELGKAAFWVMLIALAVHTFGLVARMIIQQRPPVTNLYSSAIFIGWFSVVLAAVLEWLFKNRFGSAMAAVVGLCTLIVAQNLGAQGDTLEMMRAVLDDNFWLATHVITVTMGYSATFLAGALAIGYIVGRPWLSQGNANALQRMAYGIVCFALLFSFVGTVLGGIWADQSWGRFWGWDPKENGALMIVLWNALVLHARWGKLVSPVALAQLMIVGNIITAWSYFGTNLLGVGLHSYGFTDSGFFWLCLFIASQLGFIALGYLPPMRRPATA